VAILDFVKFLTEGIDLQDAPGSQIDQHGMPFICANFGESITICSILLRKSPTNTRKPCCGRKTARCRSKLRYVPKFTAASRGSPCDSTALVS